MPKVGCLLLAGGQGTRLGYTGPKGTVVVGRKSLFAHICERAEGPVAVLTSPSNDVATRRFFWERHNFGVSDLGFVVQEELPFLDDEGNSLDEKGPAGNGWALKHLVEQGIADRWEAVGIEAVTIAQIDNALALPHDNELASLGVDVAIRCVRRTTSEEKLGVFVEGPRLVEYSEITPELRDLEQYPWGNLGIYCFALPFVRRIATRGGEMPIHRVHKKTPSGRLAWKQERFLLDCLPWANTAKIVPSDRKRWFRPIKTPEDLIAANVLLQYH